MLALFSKIFSNPTSVVASSPIESATLPTNQPSLPAETLNLAPEIALEFKKGKSVQLKQARQLCAGTLHFILGDEHFDVAATRTCLSKTGRNITVLFGESLLMPKVVIAAYPEKEHLLDLREASYLLSLKNGPGDLFHGSLGVLQADRVSRSTLAVNYLQSSFPVARAVEKGILAPEFKRCYSAWAICLIDELLKYAAAENFASIEFPKNKILSGGLNADKLRKLAAANNYVLCAQNVEDYPEEADKVFFVRKKS